MIRSLYNEAKNRQQAHVELERERRELEETIRQQELEALESDLDEMMRKLELELQQFPIDDQ
jgi:hypothetical protein